METIRTATEQDLPSLLPLALALWPENTSAETESDLREILNYNKAHIVVAGEQEKPFGFIHVEVRADYVEGADSSPTGFVEGIYVQPPYRGTGAAHRLLAVGEQWLRRQGCTQVGSDTAMDNKSGYDFHVRAGFKEAARLVAFIKDL